MAVKWGHDNEIRRSAMSEAYMRRCSTKRRYEDKLSALVGRAVVAKKAALGIDRFQVYRCDQCLGWHVGGAGRTNITNARRAGKRANKRMRGRQ